MNFPILSTIIFLPLIGAFFIFISRNKNNSSAIYVSLFTSIANFLLSLFEILQFNDLNLYGFEQGP